MYKVFFLTVLCLQSICLFSAEKNLLKNGNFARYKVNWVTDGKVTEEGKSGVLTLSGKANRAFSRQVVEFDAKRDTFLITADVSADKPVRVYLGLIPMDKNWKEIYFRNTGIVPGTFTELAEPLAKNSDTAVLKKTPAFKKSGYLALNAKADNSDLPNFQLLRFKSISHVNGKTVVKLSRRAARRFPAGSKVRCHVDGPTYLYSSALNKGFPGLVKAAGKIGANAKVKFRPGTAGFKMCLLVIPRKNAKDVKVEFRNIKIVKVNK